LILGALAVEESRRDAEGCKPELLVEAEFSETKEVLAEVLGKVAEGAGIDVSHEDRCISYGGFGQD
jgi:hypothetical protein